MVYTLVSAGFKVGHRSTKAILYARSIELVDLDITLLLALEFVDQCKMTVDTANDVL